VAGGRSRRGGVRRAGPEGSPASYLIGRPCTKIDYDSSAAESGSSSATNGAGEVLGGILRPRETDASSSCLAIAASQGSDKTSAPFSTMVSEHLLFTISTLSTYRVDICSKKSRPSGRSDSVGYRRGSPGPLRYPRHHLSCSSLRSILLSQLATSLMRRSKRRSFSRAWGSPCAT
jgi:hypothetical protein